MKIRSKNLERQLQIKIFYGYLKGFLTPFEKIEGKKIK